jgi:L-serine dehydratase
MPFISIFNDVLGPVMRGPSSSHTAGAYYIGRMARSLLAEPLASVECTFDPEGSMASTYVPLAVDFGLASGLLGWEITDSRLKEALTCAKTQGLKLQFNIAPLAEADHPNSMAIKMISKKGNRLSLMARSTGGGNIEFTKIGDWPVSLHGKSHVILVETDSESVSRAVNLATSDEKVLETPEVLKSSKMRLVLIRRTAPLPESSELHIAKLSGVKRIRKVEPLFFIQRGETLFTSARELISLANKRSCSIGEIGIAYEARVLGLSKQEIIKEMTRRFRVMKSSVLQGMQENKIDMMLLKPSARSIFKAIADGKTATGSINIRAAARAMAVMHVSNSMGTFCAAPTGGAAGVIPGVLVTMTEEKGINEDQAVMALFAASAIGVIIVKRATFAAEVAGCQMEIGAAGAMAASAVVEITGGTPQQAADAAAIAMQNTMGSVCDPVQGSCEIPCHTRNATAASNAFVCADLILGGYDNPIPLDETIDASYAVGRSLASELRCTAKGGIAAAPSAKCLKRLR